MPGYSRSPVQSQSTSSSTTTGAQGPAQQPGMQLQTGGSGGGDTSDQREAVQDMGQIDSLDSGFSSLAGAALEALVPSEGDKGKLQVNVNIPVSTGVTVGFEFVTEAERNDKGVKMKVQIGGNVTATADLWVAEAFARAQVFGYMEAQGDSGAEVFDLMLLGIHHRINQVSETVAEALFSDEQIQEIIGNMDQTGDDYVESGMGVTVSAGLGAADGSSAGVEAGVQTGTRLTRGEDESHFFGADTATLNETGVTQAHAAVSFSVGQYGSVAGKITLKWEAGRWKAVEVEVSGDLMMPISELTDGAMLGSMVSSFGASIGDACAANSGLGGDNGGAAQVGALGRFVVQNSTLGLGVEAGTQAVLEGARGFNGVNVGHKITAKGTYDRQDGLGFEVTLDRVSQIEFGDNPRASVYVLLENVQNVFTLKV